MWSRAIVFETQGARGIEPETLTSAAAASILSSDPWNELWPRP